MPTTQRFVTPEGAVLVGLKLDPAQLAWTGAFEGLLATRLRVATEALLAEGKRLTLASMQTTFAHLNLPRHNLSPTTPRLYDAIFGGMVAGGGGGEGLDGGRLEVGAGVPYAAQRELGGTITAKDAPYLVFRTPDGRWHRRASVTQPAQRYLLHATEELWLLAPPAYLAAARAALEAAIRAPGATRAEGAP